MGSRRLLSMLTEFCYMVLFMKYVLSISFGKDSLALFIKLIEKKYPLDYVLFYNTGMEFDSIYTIRDKVKAVCKTKGISYVELEPERPFLYDMLEKPVNKKDGSTQYGYQWCGGVTRWGTSAKTTACNKFYKQFGDETVIEYIGIASDELQRVDRSKRTKTIKLYPLIEWGMTENDCLVTCYKNGYSWVEDGIDLYTVLDRVSCWCCSNKNLKELYNIWRYLPTYWNRLKDLQSKIDRPMKDPYSVFDLEDRFLKQFEEEFLNE